MAAYRTSSLVASDGMKRHSSGLLKNTSQRMSKQDIMGKRMFGAKKGEHGKDLKIGKMFKKKGKDTGKTSMAGMSNDNGSIGPSVEEFEDMMDKVSSTRNTPNGKKKSMFSRKQFG